MSEEKEMSIQKASNILEEWETLFRRIIGSCEALKKAASIESLVSSLQGEVDRLNSEIERKITELGDTNARVEIAEGKAVERIGETNRNLENSLKLAQESYDEHSGKLREEEAVNKVSYNEMMEERQTKLREIQAEISRESKALREVQDKKAAIERLVSEVKVSI